MKNLALLVPVTLFAGASAAWMAPAAPTDPAVPRRTGEGSARSTPAGEGGRAESSVPESPALSWVDVDGDGRLETLVVHPDGRTALVREAAGGGLEDVTEELGLAAFSGVSEALWADANEDGAPDLLGVLRDGSLRLLSNGGPRGFQDVTAGSGLESTRGVLEAAWRELERDRAPDLVLVRRDGLSLYRNQGGYRFEESGLPLFETAPGSPTPTAWTAPSHLDAARPGPGGQLEPEAPGGEPGTRSENGRRPAPRSGAPVSFGSAPGTKATATGTGSANAPPAKLLCIQSIEDQSTGMCLEASSIPLIGSLYPLSTTFNVNPLSQRVGIGTVKASAKLQVSTSSAEPAFHAFASNDTAGFFDTLDPSSPAMQAEAPSGGTAAEFVGRVDVGFRMPFPSTNVVSRVTLRPTLSDAGELLVDDSSGNVRARIVGEESGVGARMELAAVGGTDTIVMKAEEAPGNGAQVCLATDGGVETIVMDAEFGAAAGALSMYNLANEETVQLVSQEGSTGAQLALSQADGTETIVLDADTTSNAHLSMYDTVGTETVRIVSQSSGSTGSRMTLARNDGSVSITLDAEQNGDGRITCDVLEIKGGGDLAERFDAREECPPGSVVVIDTEAPGELVLSLEPYDARVAGVVSGAGDVRPGLHLSQAGVLDGDVSVALTGRVYVRCTTENGAIRPGDLLTSSSTPGHAMRATDPERAFGAVLGKAMGELEEESGLVLVLANLQ